MTHADILKAEDRIASYGLTENYMHNLQKILGYGNLTIQEATSDWRRLSDFVCATDGQREKAINLTWKEVGDSCSKLTP